VVGIDDPIGGTNCANDLHLSSDVLVSGVTFFRTHRLVVLRLGTIGDLDAAVG
jgi:hypothetical protein